jgi:hypothetical protein
MSNQEGGPMNRLEQTKAKMENADDAAGLGKQTREGFSAIAAAVGNVARLELLMGAIESGKISKKDGKEVTSQLTDKFEAFSEAEDGSPEQKKIANEIGWWMYGEIEWFNLDDGDYARSRR